MCGICGVMNVDGRPVDSEKLRQMSSVMKYRGPDDTGIWLHPHQDIGLGHCRLSILDIEGGKQPMSNEDQRYCLVYNGEMYNYQDLYHLLKAQGTHQFRSHHSDTEAILHMYEDYRAKCLDYFDGMFAFAIVDAKEKSLFLARDPFGIKPLYYTWDKNCFVFASEIKAILLYLGIKGEVNPQSLMDYMTFQYVLGEKTLFNRIYKLMPGQYLEVGMAQGEVKKTQYWDIPMGETLDISEEEAVKTLRHILSESVDKQLRADVPVGSHLSGGLDTATIASLATGLLDKPLKTFTAGFKEGGVFDDISYARITGNAIKAEFYEIYPTMQDFLDIFPKLVWHMDEPAAGEGIFPQYYVSKLASQKVKVVLGGQGADEIMGGYTRHPLLMLETALKYEIWNQNEQKTGLSLKEMMGTLSQFRNYLPLMKHYFSHDLFAEPALRYFQLINRAGRDLSQILAPESMDTHYSPFESFRAIFEKHQHAPLLDKMLYYETRCFLPALLHLEDRVSMACSLESRVPFLNKKMAEFFFRLPTALKLKGGQTKSLLRQAARSLIPEEISNRKDKVGFPVPLARWVTQGLNPMMQDLVSSAAAIQRGVFQKPYLQQLMKGEGAFGREMWGVMNIEMWHRLFVDNNIEILP